MSSLACRIDVEVCVVTIGIYCSESCFTVVNHTVIGVRCSERVIVAWVTFLHWMLRGCSDDCVGKGVGCNGLLCGS